MGFILLLIFKYTTKYVNNKYKKKIKKVIIFV